MHICSLGGLFNVVFCHVFFPHLSLIYRGYRKPLEMSDLWSLDDKHRAHNVSKQFSKHLDLHVVPKQSVNYYQERRRISLLNSIAENTNCVYQQDDLIVDRRRSAQSILGVGIPVSDRLHTYKSGCVETIMQEDRRASDGCTPRPVDLKQRSGAAAQSTPNKMSSSVKSPRARLPTQKEESGSGSFEKRESLSTPNSVTDSVGVSHGENAFPTNGDRNQVQSADVANPPSVDFAGVSSHNSSTRRSVHIGAGTKLDVLPGHSESRSNLIVKRPKEERFAALESGLFNVVFCHVFFPHLSLIYRGYRKPLEMSDLWSLDDKHRAHNVSKQFSKHLDLHVVPKQSVNYYQERRRISLLNSIAENTNCVYQQDDLIVDRRRSAQSILGVGIPVSDRLHTYKSGCVETIMQEDRRASDGCTPRPVDLKQRSGAAAQSTPNKMSSSVKSPRARLPTQKEESGSGSFEKRESLSTPNSVTDSVGVSHGENAFPTNGDRNQVQSADVSNSALKSRDASKEKLNTPLPTKTPMNSNVHSDASKAEAQGIQETVGSKPGHSDSVQKDKQRKLGFIIALIEMFWTRLVWTGLLKLLHDTLLFISPLLLKILLKFMQGDLGEPVWHGYLYAVTMFVAACTQTLILQRYFRDVNIMGMHLRTVITCAVYRKSLRLSNKARYESTTGQIMNLISSDAQHFTALMPYVHVVWSGPFQIIVAIVLLWRELGPSVLAGIGVLLLLLPFNAVIARLSKTVQEKKFTAADSRVKIITEILNGIRVIKLYAWEPSFITEVNRLRQKEVHYLRRFAYLQSVSFLWTCAPFLVALSTFGVFVMVSDQNILDAQKAFLSLTLFNILRFPLFSFEQNSDCPAFLLSSSRPLTLVVIGVGAGVIKLYAWEPSFITEVNRLRQKEVHYLRRFAYLQSVSFLWTCAPFLVSRSILFVDVFCCFCQAYVSSMRLNHFLQLTELNPDSVLHEDTPGVAAVIERGVFGWDSEEEPVLHNISIQFPEGQLTSIMGSVGSGKSSLLHALLGDMERLNGCVNIKGSVAYVSQQPWIFNATLRDNILFLKPYDPIRYEKVIEACGLIPDLQILPNGDMTEIGDKGINLSGGQKQRVSLARACYADADVYLLDDPLSAVDAHVGMHLLDKVFSRSTGILASKTCILTTHNPKTLQFSDRVVLMVDGQISEHGTYRQLLQSRTSQLAEFLSDTVLSQPTDRSGSQPSHSDTQSVGQDVNWNAVSSRRTPHGTQRSTDDVRPSLLARQTGV
ncbi:hypothetical protein AHF37_07865 [Paragonimus kellicotti]|nr:hypothetical protein AHF37_07865 [Paragonimus kellicotti]